MILYGTYLTFLIKELFLKEEEALSAREIASRLHVYEDRRLQLNLIDRVRRCLAYLEEEEFLKKEERRGRGNTIIYFYKKNEDGEREKQASNA